MRALSDFLLNQHSGYEIHIFSVIHFVSIILVLSLALLIAKNKKMFINMQENNKKKLRYLLAIILIANLMIRRGSFLYYGVYNWNFNLDINFCNFTSILFIIYGLSGNKKIYKIGYYMAWIGPFMAILFPSVNLNPLNYSFYSYLIIHHLVFLFNFTFIYTENIKYYKKDFTNISIFLINYFLIIYIFDKITNTNYNFPQTFLNENLINIPLINILLSNKIILFLIFIIIVILLLNLGKYVLKKVNN